MSDKKPRFKIYHDEAKARLTCHWDMDYMTNDEIEAFLTSDTKAAANTVTQANTGVVNSLIRFFKRACGSK